MSSTRSYLALFGGLALCGALALALHAPTADAASPVGLDSVSTELRAYERTAVLQVPSTGANTTDVTRGVAGVVAVGTINGTDGGVTFTDGGFLDSGVAVDGGVTFTDGGSRASFTITGTDLAPPPYPCKLQVLLKDGTNDSTLTCSSVTVRGRTQFGSTISDTVSGVTETAANTARVFEVVDSVAAAGCAGAGAATDVLRVACSSVVGLPAKPPAGSDGRAAIASACIFDQSGTNEANCYRANQLTAGTSGSYDTDDAAVDCSALAALSPSITLAKGDVCQIRMRWPLGR